MLTEYQKNMHSNDIFASLSNAEPNLERLKQWSAALKADDIIQVTGDIFRPDCGGMCVLGVAFSTFFPDRWKEYVTEALERLTEPFTDPFEWNTDLTIALEVNPHPRSRPLLIDVSPFYCANDGGMTLTEIAAVIDEYVASKA